MKTLPWTQPNAFETLVLTFVLIGIPVALIICLLVIIKFLFIKYKNRNIDLDK